MKRQKNLASGNAGDEKISTQVATDLFQISLNEFFKYSLYLKCHSNSTLLFLKKKRLTLYCSTRKKISIFKNKFASGKPP